MKITIKGSPKEIAALALELQEQPKKETMQNNEAIQKQIELVSKASAWASETGQYDLLANLSSVLIELHNVATVL